MRIGRRVERRFWTVKRIRQGSPLLFNLLIADMEDGLGKDEVGGEVGGKKLKVLRYADDL